MDYLNEAKKFLRSGRDHSFNNRHTEATADLLSAIAAGLIAALEAGEPIDGRPADLVEIAGKLYSGCGEDIEQHEVDDMDAVEQMGFYGRDESAPPPIWPVGRCPLCQRAWAECECEEHDYHEALQ